MSMIGTDAEDTARALEEHAEFTAADLMRSLDARNTELRAALQDRAAENRQLRGNAARALDLLEQGRGEEAKSLLRAISRTAERTP